MSDPVDDLLARARAGDRAAFEGLVRRFLPAVHDIVSRTSRGRGVPGALVRETFHRAWRGLAGLSPGKDFARWLGGIARYVAHEAALRREPFSVARGRPGRDAADAGALLALGRLDPLRREVLLARHLDGLSREEAAARLGLSPEERDALAREAMERLRGPLAVERGRATA